MMHDKHLNTCYDMETGHQKGKPTEAGFTGPPHSDAQETAEGRNFDLSVSTNQPGDIMVRKTAVAAGLLIAASSADAFSGAGRVSTPSLRSSVASARPAARHMGGVTMQDSTPNRSDISAW